MGNQRILYIQYTNPAGYPPLEHSSRILADAGWQVLFLGTGAFGAQPLCFPSHPRVAVKQMPFHPPGWRQKMHYFRYLAWSLYWTLRWHPKWIYASDPLSCPTALLLSRIPGIRVIYHEHDSPDMTAKAAHSPFMRAVYDARRKVAHRAAFCVLPSYQRIEQFFIDNPGLDRPVICVWNCPAVEEIGPPRSLPKEVQLRIQFHGSIGPDRMPLEFLDALAQLPENVKLTIIGYETVGSMGYLAKMRTRAVELGIENRVDFVGAVPTRKELFAYCRNADIGLAMMPTEGVSVNQRTMFSGPSNKVFDYLACGTALLITDSHEWRRMYVDAGYGLGCNQSDPSNVASALRWFLHHPLELHAMGERGRQRVLSEWNYEHQFAQVVNSL